MISWSDPGTVGRKLLAVTVLLSVSPTVRLHAQCPDGSPPPCRALPARPAPTPSPNSIAVLYFDNLSPDSGDAYLANGLTEEIITRLGHLERLVVKSQAAVRRHRGSTDDPATLGRALAVALLVNGTMRRAGGGCA